jgi:hypothetical protein
MMREPGCVKSAMKTIHVSRSNTMKILSLLPVLLFLTSCVTLAAPRPAEPEASPTPTATQTLTPTPTPTVVWFPPTVTFTPFPTRATTPTPDRRPGLGAEQFSDDFSDPDLWALARTAEGSVALGKNELTIAIAGEKVYLFSTRRAPVLTDFYAEITASPTLCRDQDEYGLLLRVSENEDYYRFSIACDGHARLDRVLGREASSPQPWVLSGAIPPGAPSVSRLAVWAVGSEMRFFVNDEYLFTINDPVLPAGLLGVFARSTGDMAVTVNFSELVVREIKP